MVTNFIKYEVKSFSDAEVYTDDDDDSEEDGSFDLDKIHGADNRILVVYNGAPCYIKNPFKRIYFFSWYENKMFKKEFLKFGDVKIEKWEFHFSKCLVHVGDVYIVTWRVPLCKKGVTLSKKGF